MHTCSKKAFQPQQRTPSLAPRGQESYPFFTKTISIEPSDCTQEPHFASTPIFNSGATRIWVLMYLLSRAAIIKYHIPGALKKFTVSVLEVGVPDQGIQSGLLLRAQGENLLMPLLVSVVSCINRTITPVSAFIFPWCSPCVCPNSPFLISTPAILELGPPQSSHLNHF